MSKMLHRTQYGTTKHPHDPLKLDIMGHSDAVRRVVIRVDRQNNSNSNERSRDQTYVNITYPENELD